jgi:outer membrane protein assembly factor BamE (lipoprotein component of BamABCDE complex)
MKRVFKIALWSLAVALVTTAGLAAWSWNGHGLDVQQFQKVHAGMTMPEVEFLMGKPTVAHSENGVAVSWIYSRHLKLCRGIVCFDFTGRVQSTFHDH